ncbi:3-phosphoshikimate 1-carboxyvinyltransferase [Ilumatobacter sp.]|uniref:3-phosphoshikimate 1-carboxyvinyltransferase n=1 Tax=Ilumatobacter sp. TaxID=1967498 RepID=UPI003B528DDB
MSDVRAVTTADGPVVARVRVPPSKSIANRALICATLAEGRSEIVGIAPGDDTVAMVECLEALGTPIEISTLDGTTTAVVTGTGGALAPGPIRLDTRLAGTTSRFVTAVAALGPGPYEIDGDPPLRARPMGPLHDSLHALGARIEPAGSWGHLPVTVSGPVGGADALVMPGDVSSQFVTALMLVAPLIRDGLRLGLSSELVSRPYIEITRAVMGAFGADEVDIAQRHVHVGEGRYRARAYEVEPDASSASYPLAAAAIAGGAVAVPGLGRSSLQGDAAFGSIVEAMGCLVTLAETDTVVMRRADAALRGVDVDMADVSDLVPTVAVLAATAEGTTRITGVGFIRGKESDRLGDLATELAKTGAAVTVDDDGLTIEGGRPLHGARLETHHDHRLAMAFGVLGLAVPGIEVVDPGVVTKSWPGFWEALDSIPASVA